jgi:hypothetical protein
MFSTNDTGGNQVSDSPVVLDACAIRDATAGDVDMELDPVMRGG